YEIPALIQIPAGVRNDKLTPAVLPAVKAHPDSGPIIEEAYKALTLDTTGNNFVNLNAQQLQDAAGPALDLFTYRVGLYGAKAPEDPLAESFGTLFLTRDKVWGAEVAKQQRSTLDTMYKLCDASGNLELNGDPQKDDLVTLLRQTGRAFYVIGTILNDNKIVADGTAVSQINANTLGPDVQQALHSLQTDLNNVQLSSSAVSNGAAAPTPP
ncbi:MAG TPA: hypothetical protein VHY37_11650, partial [Tepidisphaeraceae bacterium]|nr:hypothetical protein [Tepidisphaeraceae bacterium]